MEIRNRAGLSLGPARFLALAAVLAVCLGRLPLVGAESERRAIGVVDLHVDLPYQHGYEGKSFSEGTGQFKARDLSRAGVIGAVLPLFVPARVSPSGPQIHDFEASYERVFRALGSTVPYALPGCQPRPGQVRTFLAFEGADALASTPEALVDWSARGLKSLGLVHTRSNRLASSSGDADGARFGVTASGRTLVQRALELGIAVDVSHASDRAVRDVVALAKSHGGPVIASHSNARALADHPRNLDDAALRSIAETGGVVGVNFHSPYLVRGRRARLADVVRHIRYLVRVIGLEHVAIGSDFEGDIRPPDGLIDVRGLPRLSQALEASGLSRAAVSAIFGQNALRVLCRRDER